MTLRLSVEKFYLDRISTNIYAHGARPAYCQRMVEQGFTGMLSIFALADDVDRSLIFTYVPELCEPRQTPVGCISSLFGGNTTHPIASDNEPLVIISERSLGSVGRANDKLLHL